MGRIAEHPHIAWFALGGESGGESTFLLSHLVHIARQHSYLTLLLFLLENWGTSRNYQHACLLPTLSDLGSSSVCDPFLKPWIPESVLLVCSRGS